MASMQEIFDKLEEKKKELKELNKSYKEALLNSQEYVKIDEELQAVRARKKEAELAVRADFSSEFNQMDDLKSDIASDKEMLNDLALNQLMEGETIALTDQYDNHYEPVFNVRFKKFN